MQKNGPNRFIHYSDSSLNAQSGSKQMERSARRSVGGAGDSEWAKERREKGEGQIPREQISHRSHCICVIRKEITASDEGNCKGTRITFLYIVRGGSQEAQSKRNERQLLARM